MIDTQIILALKCALGLLVMWFFVCFLWKDYCLDRFREEIFEIRDDLFLFAADGNIGFDHQAYTILRNRLNVLLRYAHEFTFMKFILAAVILSKVENSETVAWERAVASLPEAVERAVRNYEIALVRAFLVYVALRSFLLYLVVLLVGAWSICKQTLDRHMLPRMAIGFEKLESEISQEAT